MPLTDLIRNNFWIKVFSLILAVLIWFAVRSMVPDESESILASLLPPLTDHYYRPVALLISPAQGQNYQISPSNVTITVSGDPKAMEKLFYTNILAYVRMQEVKPTADNQYRVEVIVPRDISVKGIEPPVVTVAPDPMGLMFFPPGQIN